MYDLESFPLFPHKKRPPLASADEMTRFHTDDYVNFLKTITPDNTEAYAKQLVRCITSPSRSPLLSFVTHVELGNAQM